MPKLIGRLLVALALGWSGAAHAELIYRGGGMVYDTVLDITWLQDANFAYTSGYAASNEVGSPDSTPDHIQANGEMGWSAGQTWVSELVYGGYDDWRLPSIRSSTINDTGYYNTKSEIGYMYYENLGNPPAVGEIQNNSFVDGQTGETISFSNIDDAYWHSDIGDDLVSIETYYFNSNNGEFARSNKRYGLRIWAVRDGDIESDSDNDLICDQDIDIPGVCVAGPAGGDNCRHIPNYDQSDSNQDGCGDACIAGGCLGPFCANP